MTRLATLLLVLLLSTALVAQAQQTATPTPEPAAGPTTAPAFDPALLNPRQIEALPVLINARNDLELLANTYFGSTDTRPEGWVTGLDLNDPQLAVLLRLNLEILAGTIFGADPRPDGWFGAVTSTPLAIARDLRHDLELVADRVMTTATIRPAGWIGDNPLMRCDRSTQALVTLIVRAGFVPEPLDFSQPDACAQLALAAAQYAEDVLIQPQVAAAAPGPDAAVSAPSAPAASGSFLPQRAETAFVVAFLDRNARQRAGVLPVGTGFRPLNRSVTEFSNMMLIGGEGFQVWVDYTTTPVSTQDFFSLQPVQGEGGTFCSAGWCGE